MKLRILFIAIVCLFNSCNTKSQTVSATSRAKNTPEVKALLEKFNTQKHRLEINDCEIIYNGKSFFLGSTLEEVEDVLGKKYNYNKKYAFAWSDNKLLLRTDNNNKYIDLIYIYISEGYKKAKSTGPLQETYEEIIPPNENIILFNGIPITKEMKFGDFIANSTYSFEDFGKHRSFELEFENCSSNSILYNFDSEPLYNYSGAGHLQVRGSFNPNKTLPIKRISIYQSSN